MTRGHLFATALLAFALPSIAVAESTCDFKGANLIEERVVSVRGRITKIDPPKDGRYWIVVQLKDQCGSMDIHVLLEQLPRCRVGATVSVTGHYKAVFFSAIGPGEVTCLR